MYKMGLFWGCLLLWTSMRHTQTSHVKIRKEMSKSLSFFNQVCDKMIIFQFSVNNIHLRVPWSKKKSVLKHFLDSHANEDKIFLANPMLAESPHRKKANQHSLPFSQHKSSLTMGKWLLARKQGLWIIILLSWASGWVRIKGESLRSWGVNSKLPTVWLMAPSGMKTESQVRCRTKTSHNAAMLCGQVQSRMTWAHVFLNHSSNLSLYSPKQSLISKCK